MKKNVKHRQSKKQKPATAPFSAKYTACLLGAEQLVKEFSAVVQSSGIAVLEIKNRASVKTSAKKISIAFEVTLEGNDEKMKNLIALDESLPPDIPIVTNSITTTVLSQAQHLKNNQRVIGAALFPTLLENAVVELAPSLYTTQAIADSVVAFFKSLNKQTAIVEDSVGMVMPRILCQIINEALFAVLSDVANPKDIDTAMKLGTNYPHGPIEWGEKIGFRNILAVLDALYRNYGEERYRVAPLLRQMAIAGRFWS
ncbi:MAG: 3-hydroxyacyl-CoA dehydrogenase family protein [Bacteroidota bacterium]